MKLKSYFFGYLFVRLAKLFACLALLATAGALIYVVISYGLQRSRVAYQQSGDLDRQFRLLEEEVTFATREVGRIADTATIAPLKIGAAADSTSEFAENANGVIQARKCRDLLKQQLIQTLEDKARILRERIAQVVQDIERMRAATITTPPTKPISKPAPRRLTPLVGGNLTMQRSVYGDIKVPELNGMLITIREATGFFRALSKRAEKQESKVIIDDVIKELQSLSSWLPTVPTTVEIGRNTVPNPAPENEPSDSSEPSPDPLVAAMQNFDDITQAMENIKGRLLSGWILDSVLAHTQSLFEAERDRCRLAEVILKTIRLDHVVQFGKYLGIGLAIAFLILVFADFIQSFFDTATNTRDILCCMPSRANGEDEQSATKEDSPRVTD